MGVYNIDGDNLFDATKTMERVISNNLRDKAYMHQLLSESGGTMQGACTDGEFIYYIYYNRNTIKKYDIKTGTVTSKTYTDGLYGHANDMTYNPNTNKLYIATMNDYGHICSVNPSTLEYENTFILKWGNGDIAVCHGIAYDRIHNRYILTVVPPDGITAYGQYYMITDSNFNYIKTMVTPQPEIYTIQGCETDGYLIYRTLWDNTNNTNYINVYNYNGEYFKTIHIENASELESVMQDWAGNWYCNFNTSDGGSLYVCGLHKYPFESMEVMHE